MRFWRRAFRRKANSSVSAQTNKSTTHSKGIRVKTLASRVDHYFQVSKYGSTIRTEILAGISVYFSLAHTFVLNPAIMQSAGIDITAALFATAVASALTTFLMGFYARLPYALAPGAEMNSFFAFVVVGTLHIHWTQALGAAFWSGVLCLLLTAIPARQKIIDAIPDNLKTIISSAVGLFVAITGLFR